LQDLRKAVKAQRPECLEEYVIAYCMAKLRNQPPPETTGGISNVTKGSSEVSRGPLSASEDEGV